MNRSLMDESRFRLNHIEGASRRMERRAAELKRKQTLARQEEIIEEIEAILAGGGWMRLKRRALNISLVRLKNYARHVEFYCGVRAGFGKNTFDMSLDKYYMSM